MNWSTLTVIFFFSSFSSLLLRHLLARTDFKFSLCKPYWICCIVSTWKNKLATPPPPYSSVPWLISPAIPSQYFFSSVCRSFFLFHFIQSPSLNCNGTSYSNYFLSFTLPTPPFLLALEIFIFFFLIFNFVIKLFCFLT